MSAGSDLRDAARTRLRLLATCVLLTGLAFVQSPGLLVSDTKFDLAVAPGRFLARATSLWDPLGAGGQLQNQAYGYLWPMGPFFWLGSTLEVPGWAVQRAWLALVICVAFLGAAVLARALGVRSDVACILGGIAFALSPRMLTVLGPISIEAWPSALAPWVLLPLVLGSHRGSPRRAAARSALAVAMVGGVNAVATFAVIPLGALWLLTRTPGPRRRSMMTWWPLFVLIGTAWWLVPLFVLGAYSPPFLEFIESASNTTVPTTLFDALRGTSNWVPYVDRSSRAGNDLIRYFHLPLLSGVVLLVGMVGLLHRRNPHREFLFLGLLTGLLLVTMGHLGQVQGWFAPGLNSLLDGALAPLRNVHKFDPLVRLPLVLGLAWTVDLVWSALHEPSPPSTSAIEDAARRLRLRVLLGTVLVAVLAASMPALAGRITPARGVLAVPDYWKQAAGWLDQRAGDGQALLAPGSSFGKYVWGSPNDEPMQWLAGSRWSVRNAVPLTPPGTIRALDAVEARLVQGRGSPGLAPYLQRAGIAYLVVRNDLDKLADVPDSVLVHQAIQDSPGLRRVASFGPDVGGEAHLTRKSQRVLVNGGWQSEYPAVEVFSVGAAPGLAVQTQDPPTVVGGPEDLLDLSDLGVLGDQPTILASDADQEARGGRVVLTDGLRAVERNFGRVHDGASATLVPGQPRRLGNPARDYLLRDADRWSTRAYVAGARSVTASSSMSDASALGVVQGGQQPYAALDGRADTVWRANYRVDEPAWWQVDFTARRAVGSVRITAGPDDREVVRVRTAGREVRRVVVQAGATREVSLDDPGSGFLRVTDDSGRPGNQLTLAAVDVPDLEVTRGLRLPDLPPAWGDPDDIVLRAVSDHRRGCAELGRDVRCREGQQVAGEEESQLARRFSLAASGAYRMSVEAQVLPGAALARTVLAGQPVDVTASSTGTTDPRGSILSAVDGDTGTTWTAALTDTEPLVNLNWIDRRRISGLDLSVDQDTAAKLPTRLALRWPGGRRTVEVSDSGRARFPAIRVSQLSIRVLDTERASSLDYDSVAASVPVGITELRVTGLPYLPVALPTAGTRATCGSGPTVTVNGVPVRTRVSTPLSDVAGQDRVTAEVCGDADVLLRAGDNEVRATPSTLFAPRSLVLTSTTSSPTPATPATPVTESSPSPVRRVVGPSYAGGVLALRENTNPGWSARQGGRALSPVVLDGWQQGWQLDDRQDGTGAVLVDFGPDRPYRWALGLGLVALLGLVCLAVLWRPSRRGHRRDAAALTARPMPTTLLAGSGLLGAGLLAGWTGLGVGAVSLLVASVLGRRAPDAVPWLAAALVLPPAMGYALHPWGGAGGWAGASAWPHYFVVAALSAVAARPATDAVLRRLPRSFSRIPGFSTQR